MQRGVTTTGTRMVKIPNPHLKPGPARMASVIGPPIQVVTTYGELAKASIKDRFLRDEVSATNTVKQ